MLWPPFDPAALAPIPAAPPNASKLATWATDYNTERPHSGLDYLTPAAKARSALRKRHGRRELDGVRAVIEQILANR